MVNILSWITPTAFIPKPTLIDRGYGLIYDVERDITWMKDANYARTVHRTPDGQLTWPAAMSWVASLSYKGIAGWRLPTALNPDGSGPFIGYDCTQGEIGHLFEAGQRNSKTVSLDNFDSDAIYWTSTESPDDPQNEAIAFALTGLRQGGLPKDPFAPDPVLGGPVPLLGPVLAWPVHDGDVAAQIFRRRISITSLVSTIRISRKGS